jgi:hypothetical protein
VNWVDPWGLYSEWFSGQTGRQAHANFFTWVRNQYPDEEFIFDRPLNTLNLGISMNRPDVIHKASGQIWELKPLSHEESRRYDHSDAVQLDKYICETGFMAGDPVTLVQLPTELLDPVYDVLGNEYRVILYPGRTRGFIYYDIEPTGRNRYEDGLRKLKPNYDPKIGPVPTIPIYVIP